MYWVDRVPTPVVVWSLFSRFTFPPPAVLVVLSTPTSPAVLVSEDALPLLGSGCDFADTTPVILTW